MTQSDHEVRIFFVEERMREFHAAIDDFRKWAGRPVDNRLLGGVYAALLAACLAFGFVLMQAWGVVEWPTDVLSGEELYHRLWAPNWNMPLKYLLPSILRYHNPFHQTIGPAALGLVAIAFIFALAGLLGSPAAAGLATIALVTAPDQLLLSVDVIPIVLFLLVTAAAVWREYRPSRSATVTLAVVIGATLLYRSSLFLLGPALALRELWLAGRLWRRSMKDACILALLPFVFLLPWIVMNWRIYGHFIPFEFGEADSNIVAGVLGHVTGIEGDWRQLVSDPPDSSRSGAVLAWAARRIWADPFLYARGVSARWRYFVVLHPGLLLISLLSFLRWRRQPGWAAAAFIGFYFIGVHSLMAIHDSYLSPLTVLLTVLACFVVFAPPRSGADGDDLFRRFSVALAGMGWLSVIVLALFSAARVGALARSKPSGEVSAAFDAEITANPRDASLFAERARWWMSGRKWARATSDLTRALVLRPVDDEARRLLAIALFAQGYPGSLFKEKPEQEIAVDASVCVRFRILRALQCLRWHRRAEALRELDSAWRLWRSESMVGEEFVKGEVESQGQARLLAQGRTRFIARIKEELSSLDITPGEQRVLLRAVNDVKAAAGDGSASGRADSGWGAH